MRGTLIQRTVERRPSFVKQVWELTWGLVLVIGLTIVSECGLRLGYAKASPPAPPVASQPVAPAAK